MDSAKLQMPLVPSRRVVEYLLGESLKSERVEPLNPRLVAALCRAWIAAQDAAAELDALRALRARVEARVKELRASRDSSAVDMSYAEVEGWIADDLESLLAVGAGEAGK